MTVFETKISSRSSAQGEDSAQFPMAGVFTSCLDVESTNIEALATSVDTVSGSYSGNSQDQVLTQPILFEVTVSGVTMTQDVGMAHLTMLSILTTRPEKCTLLTAAAVFIKPDRRLNFSYTTIDNNS